MRFWYDMARVAAAAIKGDLKFMVGDPANPDNAFYADAADLATVFRYNLKSLALVNPVINHLWTLYKFDGSTPYNPGTSSSKSLVVDKGVKANLSAVFYYPTPGNNQAAPTSVSGNFGTTLQPPDTNSNPALIDGPVTSGKSYSVTLSKPKTGLVVSGSQVVEPTGNDTTTDSISIAFRGRGTIAAFAGASLTAVDIQGVLNNAPFITNAAGTFSGVTATGGKYLYWLRDASAGLPASLLINDADAYQVTEVFVNLGTVDIVNAAGFTMPVNVLRWPDKDAFNNDKLQFA